MKKAARLRAFRFLSFFKQVRQAQPRYQDVGPRLTAVMDPDRSSSRAPTADIRSFWCSASTGFILGMLLWIGARELGIRAIPLLRSSHLILGAGLAGKE